MPEKRPRESDTCMGKMCQLECCKKPDFWEAAQYFFQKHYSENEHQAALIGPEAHVAT